MLDILLTEVRYLLFPFLPSIPFSTLVVKLYCGCNDYFNINRNKRLIYTEYTLCIGKY